MSQKQTVIYAAATVQEAYLLKDVLAEAGIVALVTNEVLEGGAGVDVIGWTTLARVVVGEDDAEAARRIALYFDGAKDRLPDDLTEETNLTDHIDDRLIDSGAGEGGESGVTIDIWPRCPECDAPRPTKCPICGTIGSDFHQADPDFIGTPDKGEPAEAASCKCSSGGCSSGHAAGEEEPVEAGEQSPDEFEEAEPVGLMLMCPTCDEPFAPEFPRRCAWCDHEFDDGYEVDHFHDEPPEEVGSRVLLVIFFLMALLLAVVFYFVAVL